MRFEPRQFSKRFPPVTCALFFVTDSPFSYDAVLEMDLPTVYRATACAIILPSGSVYVGVALCSPSDQYVRKVGRAKALGRAAQVLSVALKANSDDPTDWVTIQDGDEGIKATRDAVRKLCEEQLALRKSEAINQAALYA